MISIPNPHRLWMTLVAGTLLLALMAAPVAAHSGNNHGTIKVHDDETERPAQRNVPHVSCEFWIEGFKMSTETGTIVFYGWPPTGDKSEVQADGDQTFDGTPDESGKGFHFLAGPFVLEPGHYRVEVFLDDPHPGAKEHFAKAKMFWVDPCPGEDVPPPPPECPPLDLTAIAQQDTSIDLTWNDAGVDSYVLYRAVEDGEFEFLTATSDTSYTDTDTVLGVTYRYAIVVVEDGRASDVCEIAEATAIPFFPSAVVGAFALVGGVAAYAVLRRRG